MTYQEVVGNYLALQESVESYPALDDDFVIERHGPLSRLYLTSQNR
jgi:hypothetical protein